VVADRQVVGEGDGDVVAVGGALSETRTLPEGGAESEETETPPHPVRQKETHRHRPATPR
jgi:hypothetical protein